MRGAVGLVHGNQQAMRAGLTRNGQHLDQVAAEVPAIARSLIEHGGALASLAGKVDSQGETLERHGQTQERHGEILERHGEMLAEILRRLPAGPE